MDPSSHTETRELDIDVVKLHRYLSRRLPAEFIGPIKVKKLATGQSNPTYKVETASSSLGSLAIRRKPFGQLPASAHAIDREFRVMKSLREAANCGHTYHNRQLAQQVPVPRMLLYCDGTDVIGSSFFVMEFLQGRTFSHPSLPGLSAKDREGCYDSILRALAALHMLDFENGLHLKDWKRQGNYYRRQARKLAEVSEYQARFTTSIPDLEWQTEWLANNAPEEQEKLIHGDFKVDNFIFHPSEPRLIGIVDWEMSTIGHPLSDLATFVCMNQLSVTTQGDDSGSTGDIISEEECLKKYRSYVGKSYGEASWNYCKAFFYFKYSIIAQGVAARAAQGTASSAEADTVAKYVPLLAWLATSAMKTDTNTGRAPKL
eukprot:gb/GECG01009684.1/.p1 GENE.gb/GECG01009684.1/~~gb/GECG01009684.1/.p1  ORF type:complete len:374 (+),score=44.82 gb/GECG01009684.1/:1-1122(+)